jgi:N-acetylglucosaminyl-diphospho-decaprenol L-rhamnosyltransferase
MVTSLLEDLAGISEPRLEIIVTNNIPTVRRHMTLDNFPMVVIENDKPRGFGANHNAAFARAQGDFFCVLNPDIRISRNPFPALLAESSRAEVGIAAPKILNPSGRIEDSARRFPTVSLLVRKAFGAGRGGDYDFTDRSLSPDWVAGMFMLFRKEVFSEVGGFDDRYFLYYEDVDLCRRLRLRGLDIRLVASVDAVHDARRDSRHNLRHMRWHVASMIRYFLRSTK